MINVHVRVDSNLITGYGHLSRCMNLCIQWFSVSKEYAFIFYGNYNQYALDALAISGFTYVNVDDYTYEYIDFLALKNAQIVVLDSYMLSQDILDSYASTGIFSVLISDTMEFDYSLISCVINFRINAEKEFKYNSKFSCLGLNYLIVNPLLDAVREENENNKIQPEQCSRLLLFLGGGFSDNKFVSKLVEIIHSLNPMIQIFHLTYDSIDFGHNYFPLKPGKRFYSLIKSCDTLITGGGLIKYEGCYTIMPVGSFSTSRLQFEDSLQLSNASLHKDLGMIDDLTSETTLYLLQLLLLDKKNRSNLIRNCTQNFESFPTANLVSKIINQYEQLQSNNP